LFNTLSITTVNNKNIYATDSNDSENIKTIQGMLIFIICINLIIIVCMLLKFKLVTSNSKQVLNFLIILLKLFILIAGILGIIFFKSTDLKKVNSLDIGFNHTNINIIKAFIYITYIICIISPLFLCGFRPTFAVGNYKNTKIGYKPIRPITKIWLF
jgi:glucan phosphoethanolaminetransferase (alkaline phosphatase superfamily)